MQCDLEPMKLAAYLDGEVPDAEVRARATVMQNSKQRSYFGPGEPDPAATEAALSHATVYPTGTQLPQGFRDSARSPDFPNGSDCLATGATCDIYVVSYGSGNDTAVIVRTYRAGSATTPLYPPIGLGRLFQREPDGKWVQTGTITHLNCPSVIAALREGRVTAVRPEHDDLIADGVRLHVSATRSWDDRCGAEAPSVSGTPQPARDAQAPPHMGPAFGTRP